MPDWIGFAIAFLIAIGGLVWTFAKVQRTNRGSPLQRKLADHMEAFARSSHDEIAFEELKQSLDAELDAARIPRADRRDRLLAATQLFDRSLKGDRGRATIKALKKLRIL